MEEELEESSLNLELQRIIDMVHNGDMEELLELGQSANSLEYQNPGRQPTIGEPNKFLSLVNESFHSREDLLGAVRNAAFQQGYATVIRRSKADKNVVIRCDRGGYYKGSKIPAEERKRKSASRLIDCPFEIRGKKKKIYGGLWKVEIYNLSHNHEPSADMFGHPSYRRLSEQEVLLLQEMNKAGIQPRQILSSLRQRNPNLQAISRTIYNMIAKIRKESLRGRPIIQALLEELGEGGFFHNVKYDEEGHLTHLIFAHPKSIQLTKSYPNVFVMDCTYKTNKYNMTLLDIIGVSSFNTSFYSCFVFLQREEEQDYVWALKMFSRLLGVDQHPLTIITDREFALMNAVNVVFPRTPNLLCLWHIEKNIFARCKAHFKEEVDWVSFITSWNNLIKSDDELSFDIAWSHFEVEYKEKEYVLKYIRGTWLPLKEKIVRAWTEQVRHFGNHVTSRAEGAHATLKMYLQASTGGLREVRDKICLAIDNQFQEIKTQLSSEKVRVPQMLHISFFQELITHVSFFALFELHKQYELAISSSYSSQCKGQFCKTMGLPCVHMIRMINTEVFPLSDIHDQWRIDTKCLSNDDHSRLDDEESIDCLFVKLKDKYEKLPLMQKDVTKRQLSQLLGTPLPSILEPTVQPHKGRPSGSKKSKHSNSTKRDPSLFEIVEKQIKRGGV